MASFDYPPLTPDPDPAPLSPSIPLNPPMVGDASPFEHVDGQNRDLILESIRAWIRHSLLTWTKKWQDYLVYWLALVADWLNEFVTEADAYITDHAIAGYSFRTTVTDIAGSGTTDVVLVVPDPDHRPVVAGDLVLDQSADGNYGRVSVVIDATHATVTFLGSLRGPQGLTGANGHGWWTTVTTIAHSGNTAVVITAGDRPVQVGDFVVDQSASAAYGEVTVVTDSTHVTVAYIGTLQGPAGGGGGGGGVDSVVGSSTINVDATDPANPIVSVNPDLFAPLPVDSTLSYLNITGAYGWVDSSGTRGVLLSINGVELGDAAGGSAINISHDDAFGTAKIQMVGDHPLGLTVNADVVGNLDPTQSGGSIIYDSTLHALFFSNGTAWVKLADTVGAGVDSVTAGTGGITVDNTDPANPVVSYGGGALPFAIPVYAGNITDLDPDTYPDSMVYANDDSGNQWLFFSRTPGFWTAVNPTLVAGDGISIDNPGGDPSYTLVITNTDSGGTSVNSVTGFGDSLLIEPTTGSVEVRIPALDAPDLGHGIVMQNNPVIIGFGNGDAGMAFTSSGTDLTLFLATGSGEDGVASIILSPTANPGRISLETIDLDGTTIEVTLDKGGLQWTNANAGFVGLPGWTDEGLAGFTDAIIPGSMIYSIDHHLVYVRNSDDTGWESINTTPVV